MAVPGQHRNVSQNETSIVPWDPNSVKNKQFQILQIR